MLLVTLEKTDTTRFDGLFSHDLLACGRVLDAVAELALVALAACQRDVGKEVQDFARGRRRSARRLEAVPPPGGRGYGRSRGVPVESDGSRGVIRAGVGQTLGVAVGDVNLAGRQDVAGIQAGGQGGGRRVWGAGQRRRTVGAYGTS